MGEPCENLGNLSHESNRAATKSGRITWENLERTSATLAKKPAHVPTGEGEPLGRRRTSATLAENPADVPPREGESLGRTLREPSEPYPRIQQMCHQEKENHLGEPWENLGNLSRESGTAATKRGRTTWENLGRTLGEPWEH